MNKNILVPSKAHIIFDQTQAYAAYSLPKIQYKPHDFTNDKVETMQIIRKQLDEIDEPPKKLSQKVQSAFPTRSEPRLKDWNVNYLDDIGKRIASKQNLPIANNKEFIKEFKKMQSLPPKKKTKRHKTKFKIQKTLKNQQGIQKVVCSFINSNKKSVNDEVVRIKDYEQSAPFFLETLDFAERLIPEKQQFKEKYGLDEKNLRKNNLILEEVLLKRMQKRENARNRNKVLRQDPSKKPTEEQKIETAQVEIVQV